MAASKTKGEVSSKLRRDDTVIVIAGKDKGKTGRILRIDRVRNRVVVEGVNMVKKAQRRRRENESGGIVEIEASIHASNVMYVDKGGRRARLGYAIEGDSKARIVRRTGDKV